jgi:hypothetical protein
MEKRRTKVIKDSKQRGKWAESVFVARAAENRLPVSKPLGDANSFDCVVGRPGKFVAVQVKCTMAAGAERGGIYLLGEKQQCKVSDGGFRFPGGIRHSGRRVAHHSGEGDSRSGVGFSVHIGA